MSKPSARKNLADRPQLWVVRNTASMPSVVMSTALLRRVTSGVGEVGPQRRRDERRQRRLGLDGVVLHLADEVDGQVHVELLDLVVGVGVIVVGASTHRN